MVAPMSGHFAKTVWSVYSLFLVKTLKSQSTNLLERNEFFSIQETVMEQVILPGHCVDTENLMISYMSHLDNFKAAEIFQVIILTENCRPCHNRFATYHASRHIGDILMHWKENTMTLCNKDKQGNYTRHFDTSVPADICRYEDVLFDTSRHYAVVITSETLWYKMISGLDTIGLNCLLNGSILISPVLHQRLAHSIATTPTLQAKSFLVHYSIGLNIHLNLLVQSSQIRTTGVQLARNEPKARMILFSHISNEEVMLPFWIKHHASLFDEALVVDYNSTDDSRQIFLDLAPPTWRLVPTKHHKFTSRDSDAEIMEYEDTFPGAWKLVLTVGEFLVAADLKELLHTLDVDAKNLSYVRFPSFTMVGDDFMRPLNRSKSLLSQRSQYAINPFFPREWFGLSRFARFMHRIDHCTTKVGYGSGRHNLEYDGLFATDEILAQVGIKGFLVDDGSFIAKYKWTPWPESIARMLDTFSKYEDKDINNNIAKPHRQMHVMTHHLGSSDALSEHRSEVLSTHFLFDFKMICLKAKFRSSKQHSTLSGKDPAELSDAIMLAENHSSIENIELDASIKCNNGCFLADLHRKFHSKYLSVTGVLPSFAEEEAAIQRPLALSSEAAPQSPPMDPSWGLRCPSNQRRSDRFSLETKVVGPTGEDTRHFLNASFMDILCVDTQLRQFCNLAAAPAGAYTAHLEGECKKFCEDILLLLHEDTQACIVALKEHLRAYLLDGHAAY